MVGFPADTVQQTRRGSVYPRRNFLKGETMYKILDVKDKLIEHLMKLDLTKISMADLSTYTGIVCQITALDKPDYMQGLMEMTKTMMAKNEPVPVMEEVKNDG